MGLSIRSTFSDRTVLVTPYLVDHSAYDAYALLIESNQKRFFYSGDLRAHGRKSVLFEQLIANPPKDINAMLIEGSSLGRLNDDEQFPSEAEIEARLADTFSTAKGLVLLHTSAQNIDRIVSIFRACKRTGRNLIIDLYTAVILKATENLKIPQSNWAEVELFIPQAQRIQIKKNAWFDLLKNHSSNRIFIEGLQKEQKKSVLLFRPLHCSDLERGNCLTGAIYVYSQWEGYWESETYKKLRTWLEQHAIPKISIHTSGHASPRDLERLVASMKPQKVVPIHTFFPERYAELFKNVEIHEDGEWWEV